MEHICEQLQNYGERLRKTYANPPTVKYSEKFKVWLLVDGDDDFYCNEILYCPYCSVRLNTLIE